jgi:hypothetical protein
VAGSGATLAEPDQSAGPTVDPVLVIMVAPVTGPVFGLTVGTVGGE